MRNIVVNLSQNVYLEDQKIEIVERKGLGHPDTICDAIMNEVSIKLSQEYLKKFGSVMHHNVDKSLLLAGEVETKFGKGLVRNPMKLIFGDRATFNIGTMTIPVKDIAKETAKDWFKNNIRFVNPDDHVLYQVDILPGSGALTDIFKRGGEKLGANDTSAAVGWAPLTRTENIILDTEKYLNSKGFKYRFPESGEDIKIMGLRNSNKLELTISMAFVDRFVESEKQYFEKKHKIKNEIVNFLEKKNSKIIPFEKININFNSLDVAGRGENGVYLTVLGTSADGADSGQVGRGNRPNGLISLNRPQCSEAAAGKNPVSHVGKIYNLLTHKIADCIYQQVEGIKEVYVWMLSKIGTPIDTPVITSIQLLTEKNVILEKVKKDAQNIANYELENINDFCNQLIDGKIQIC